MTVRDLNGPKEESMALVLFGAAAALAVYAWWDAYRTDTEEYRIARKWAEGRRKFYQERRWKRED